MLSDSRPEVRTQREDLELAVGELEAVEDLSSQYKGYTFTSTNHNITSYLEKLKS